MEVSSAAATTELLSINDVRLGYGDGTSRLEVLKGVSMTVSAGELVAVAGSSQAGRTTLMRAAAGLLHVKRGRVVLLGRNLAELSDRERRHLLRRQILWSVPDLMSGWRASDYVAVSLLHSLSAKEARSLARHALDRVGVAAHKRPLEELSRVERLLVEFARCTVQRPDLMVVDDMFDGLGTRTREVRGQLRALAMDLGCGVLLSVTDLASARVADTIWHLDQGVVTRLSDGRDNVALAQELHERGFKDVVAMIMGCTLERHLRRLAIDHDIPVERRNGLPEKANGLNGALAREGVYGLLQQKYVTAWLDLRNKATHGQFAEYDDAHVAELLDGVSAFILRHSAS